MVGQSIQELASPVNSYHPSMSGKAGVALAISVNVSPPIWFYFSKGYGNYKQPKVGIYGSVL